MRRTGGGCVRGSPGGIAFLGISHSGGLLKSLYTYCGSRILSGETPPSISVRRL